MVMFFKSLFISATLASLIIAHVSGHSLVKRKITGDKLYVLFNRNSCVTVQSDAICPVSWSLPPVYALNYKTKVENVRIIKKVLGQQGVNQRCINVLSETICTQITPKCLSNGAKDYGINVRTQCQEIYDTSTCPSAVANAYKEIQFCEKIVTGTHTKAACVAPDEYIHGVCPQPKYKMPADFLESYKKVSPALVEPLKKLQDAVDENGEHLFSTRCISLIKDFDCNTFYCSKDENKLLVEHDYEDCVEAEQCYTTAFDKKPTLKTLMGPLLESLKQMCVALPKGATAEQEDPGEKNKIYSVGNTNQQSSNILFLFAAAVYFGFLV